jgi:hypothetical protein
MHDHVDIYIPWLVYISTLAATRCQCRQTPPHPLYLCHMCPYHPAFAHHPYMLTPHPPPLPQAQLEALIGQGLSLQDFMFHCLRNCYVVLMNARDESASFSIFATLNGRGINLSPVDKLKADLLQVLVGQQQRDWADRWARAWGVCRHTVSHVQPPHDPATHACCVSAGAFRACLHVPVVAMMLVPQHRCTHGGLPCAALQVGPDGEHAGAHHLPAAV